MLEQLNKNDYNVLEYHFNNYCRMMYNKTYPLTLDNLKKYLEQVVFYIYSKEIQKNIENFRWVEEDNKLINIVDVIETGKNISIVFIGQGNLYNAGIMARFNETLRLIL